MLRHLQLYNYMGYYYLLHHHRPRLDKLVQQAVHVGNEVLARSTYYFGVFLLLLCAVCCRNMYELYYTVLCCLCGKAQLLARYSL